MNIFRITKWKNLIILVVTFWASTVSASFAPDGCFKWSGSNQMALSAALNDHLCVEVQAGNHLLDRGVYLKAGQTLRGINAEQSVIRANPTAWIINQADSLVSDDSSAGSHSFHISNLTLDGAGIATYNLCCRGYEVQNTVLKNARCHGLGAAGPGVVARNNHILNSGVRTSIPGRGTVTCATGNLGGVNEGAGIYMESTGASFGALFLNNVIGGSFGPALDVNGSWGGVFQGNRLVGNTSWAAISLYGASNWIIKDNNINHPSGQPGQPYHPYCQAGSAGANSAGIFLCQDKDSDNLTTNNNVIVNNRISSFYGILSIGADEVKPYWAPRRNVFVGNDVTGSVVGCADDFAPGQWFKDDNQWFGNNCAGATGTAPNYF